ncbi:hypothetical protein BJV74DRAFT_890119 [Russula compacta]|nr:hypothetical protein BJV74DRAFT_890119 [Russula compacta]
MAEAEAEANQLGEESDYPSSSSESNSSDTDTSSSDNEEPPTPSDVLLDVIAQLYLTHYYNTREPIPKDSNQLHLLLYNYKINRPEIFQSYLQVSPGCFNDLVEAIKDDEIFHNNSNNPQMPIEQQLAIALYCFGHYENAASTMKVALWAGIGFGTVPLVTNAAKATAKVWTEEASWPTWQDGWLMVDGTLVPLFMHPAFFGNTWFNCKSNYSMDIQLISTPDLHIIDFVLDYQAVSHWTECGSSVNVSVWQPPWLFVLFV